jgi:hypothetical protein
VRTGLADRKSVSVAVLVTVLLSLALTASLGQASDHDQTIVTVEVSSADHELQEGYFTLGDKATVMAKPGSDLYNFLSRQRGRKIKITLEDASGAALSRLQRLDR